MAAANTDLATPEAIMFAMEGDPVGKCFLKICYQFLASLKYTICFITVFKTNFYNIFYLLMILPLYLGNCTFAVITKLVLMEYGTDTKDILCKKGSSLFFYYDDTGHLFFFYNFCN